jgi:APA family basic amino acid/polyamine antiporter
VHEATAGPPRELPRLLGAWSAGSILIGSVIGSGVFMKPQAVAQSLPSPGWILAAWAVSGLLALIGSLAFAEMSARYPQAGGQYVYLREAYGPFPAFLFGWTNLTIINAASIAALGVISAQYLVNVAGIPIGPKSAWLQAIAVALIGLLTAANGAGVLWGARIQNLLTALKLLALGALIAGPLLPGRAHLDYLEPFWRIRGSGDWESVRRGFNQAFLAIFWAYDGWYLLSFSGGEIRNPRRNIPLGFTVGILVVIAVYLLANLSFLAAIPLSEMAGFQEKVVGGVGAEAARRFYGGVGLTMISVGVLGSTLGAANGNVLTGPRLFYAMAKDRLFFRPFGDVHPRFLTPLNAIVTQGLLSALCVYAGNFDDLTDSVVFAAWTFYGLTVAGLFILRRSASLEPLPFRMPGYPLLPALFVLFAAVFVVYSAWDAAVKVREALAGWSEGRGLETTGLYPLFVTVVILLGVPVYLFFRRRARAGSPLPERAALP